MGLDLSQAYDWIVAELERHRPVAESMASLIDRCEAARPHSDWSRLRSIPYSDLWPIFASLKRPFQEEPPDRPLKGLWFGLFNPCHDGRPVADIYVCGSERFYPDPDDNSWAVGPDWWPETRYARSSVLADIYRIAYRQDASAAEQHDCLGNDAEYPLCLGYGSFAVRDMLEQVEPSLILGDSDVLGIAVGFDSGGSILLGNLARDGLRPIELRSEEQESAFDLVFEDLRSEDNKHVVRALFMLQQFGERAKAAAPEMVRIAGNSDHAGLRQAAILSLATIAPDHPQAKLVFLQAFKDTSPFVRREALQAMISIAELSAQDLAEIKNMENDPDDAVSRWSKIALDNIRLRNADAAKEPNA